MKIHTLRQQFRDLGAKPCHEARLLRAWTQRLPLDGGPRPAEHFLPLAVRNALPSITPVLEGLATLKSEHPGEDGASRLLVALADGQTVESVLLPRGGLCVSTQLGCAVGCVFCMTGRDGLIRQLGSAEIVAQVVLARRMRAVKKVVFMGMGEPAHNLENVLEAIDLLGSVGAIAAAIGIIFTGWTVLDPLLSVLVALLVVKSAWGLVHDSVQILLQAAPRDLDSTAVLDDLRGVEGVAEVGHFHAWTLTDETRIATVHVVPTPGTDPLMLPARVAERLRTQHAIEHATVQVDPPGTVAPCV